jgi:uncharacterized protein
MLAAAPTMSPESTHASPRMCAGCKAEAPRDALVRFAISDEAPYVAPDVASRLQGRGVSVHPTRACIRAALKNGGFSKAARKPVTFSLEDLARSLASKYAQRAGSLLGAARRNGTLVLGTDGTLESIQLRKPALVVLAADAAGSRDDIVRAAEAAGIEVVTYSDKVALGALLGRGDVGVVALTDASLAREISRAIARCAALSEAE